MQYQSTLRDSITFEGNGLHTGLPSRVTVFPMRAGNGLRFRLNDAVTFPARGAFVVDTRRATVLGYGEHTVSTVEHLLSALAGMGIDNALIDVHGPEIPVADGSAKDFAEAIFAVGTATLTEPRLRFTPTAPAVFRDGDKVLVVAPASTLRIKMAVDYPEPVGAQYFDGEIEPEFYLREIAPNRTFGFLHEVEALIRRGLAQGGSLENAVVFGPDGPLRPLRHPNEAVRHKVLDLIGDLALLGARPQCEIIALKSGHKLHCTAVRELGRSIPIPSEIAASTAVGP